MDLHLGYTCATPEVFSNTMRIKRGTLTSITLLDSLLNQIFGLIPTKFRGAQKLFLLIYRSTHKISSLLPDSFKCYVSEAGCWWSFGRLSEGNMLLIFLHFLVFPVRIYLTHSLAPPTYRLSQGDIRRENDTTD